MIFYKKQNNFLNKGTDCCASSGKIKDKGFVLTELLVTITILVLISASVYEGFVLTQRAYKESELSAEITQNGRVITERMTRDIRQARKIAGDLPEEKDYALDEITFEDGHVSEQYHYVRYFKSNDKINKEVTGYYFSGDALQTLMPYNAVPPVGQTLLTKTLEQSRTIGEYVSDLKIWKMEGINISLSLEKKDRALYLETKVLGRNI
jgi:prepilin-type N-terminal cleavage/methylation domain-containing protein